MNTKTHAGQSVNRIKRADTPTIRNAKRQDVPFEIVQMGIEGKPVRMRFPSRAAYKLYHRDQKLYDKYAKSLEATAKGQFVAISLDGQTILDDDHARLLWTAGERFGDGRFTIRKIGYDYVLRWR